MKYQFETDEIKNCVECPMGYMFSGHDMRCKKEKRYIPKEDVDKSLISELRPNWCPLVEVQDDK